jgi:hypothetical protein
MIPCRCPYEYFCQAPLGILRDLRATYYEDFQGFSLTKFDGTMITM